MIGNTHWLWIGHPSESTLEGGWTARALEGNAFQMVASRVASIDSVAKSVAMDGGASPRACGDPVSGLA